MKQNLLKYVLMIVLAMIASIGLLWADCYREYINDTVLIEKTDTVFKTDTITRVETIVMDADFNGSKFWNVFLLPLFVSVLGTFAALFLTYLLLRPKFEIDSIATQTLNNRVWFVVRNKSWFAKLYSIKAELAYIRYSDVRDDIEIIPIDLDFDDSISILSRNIQSKTDSCYAFHTKEAFVRDVQYNAVRLRVSATNTISNIFDAKDRIFAYSYTNTLESKLDDIRWGELNDNIHIPITQKYTGGKLDFAKRIIVFNEIIMPIFYPYSNQTRVERDKEKWDLAKAQLKSLGKMH